MPDRFVWTAADGTSVELSDRGAGYTIVKDGTTGFRSPAYSFATQEYAGLDGAEVRAIKASAAIPTLGMVIDAADPLDLRNKIRALNRAMRPKAGPGTLTVSGDDGSTRSLSCYFQGGLEGDDSQRYPTWCRAVLKFYAPDPWWLGEEQTLNLSLGAGGSFFPFFPLVLAPSSVQGEFTIDLSDTDNGAFPVWTITGPGSGLVLTNNTTTRSLTVNASLASGETMVIDTRPDFQSVRRGDGTNLLGSVDGYPDLWPLIEDVQSVTAALTGATSNSQIQGSWQPRYAGI